MRELQPLTGDRLLAAEKLEHAAALIQQAVGTHVLNQVTHECPTCGISKRESNDDYRAAIELSAMKNKLSRMAEYLRGNEETWRTGDAK